MKSINDSPLPWTANPAGFKTTNKWGSSCRVRGRGFMATSCAKGAFDGRRSSCWTEKARPKCLNLKFTRQIAILYRRKNCEGCGLNGRHGGLRSWAWRCGAKAWRKAMSRQAKCSWSIGCVTPWAIWTVCCTTIQIFSKTWTKFKLKCSPSWRSAV